MKCYYSYLSHRCCKRRLREQIRITSLHRKGKFETNPIPTRVSSTPTVDQYLFHKEKGDGHVWQWIVKTIDVIR